MSRDRRSPWGVRLWFEGGEFDQIMDRVRRRAGDVFVAGQGVDVEAVLLRVFGISPDYVDLPHGVLGRTVFRAGGGLEVELSRRLSQRAERSGVARRRLRSTMAHECGHVVLHRRLNRSALETPPLGGPAILCRATVLKGGDPPSGEWWEYQANRAMACLLMPSQLVREVLPGVLLVRGHKTLGKALQAGEGRAVLRDLSTIFDVSFELALYRLFELGFLPRPTPARHTPAP